MAEVGQRGSYLRFFHRCGMNADQFEVEVDRRWIAGEFDGLTDDQIAAQLEQIEEQQTIQKVFTVADLDALKTDAANEVKKALGVFTEEITVHPFEGVSQAMGMIQMARLRAELRTPEKQKEKEAADWEMLAAVQEERAAEKQEYIEYLERQKASANEEHKEAIQQEIDSQQAKKDSIQAKAEEHRLKASEMIRLDEAIDVEIVK